MAAALAWLGWGTRTVTVGSHQRLLDALDAFERELQRRGKGRE